MMLVFFLLSSPSFCIALYYICITFDCKSTTKFSFFQTIYKLFSFPPNFKGEIRKRYFFVLFLSISSIFTTFAPEILDTAVALLACVFRLPSSRCQVSFLCSSQTYSIVTFTQSKDILHFKTCMQSQFYLLGIITPFFLIV